MREIPILACKYSIFALSLKISSDIPSVQKVAMMSIPRSSGMYQRIDYFFWDGSSAGHPNGSSVIGKSVKPSQCRRPELCKHFWIAAWPVGNLDCFAPLNTQNIFLKSRVMDVIQTCCALLLKLPCMDLPLLDYRRNHSLCWLLGVPPAFARLYYVIMQNIPQVTMKGR